MKLSKNSLIYRSFIFHDSLWGGMVSRGWYAPSTLCKFVTQYITKVIAFASLAAIVISVLISLLFGAAVFVTGLPFNPQHSVFLFFTAVILFVAVILLSVAIPTYIIYKIVTVIDTYRSNKRVLRAQQKNTQSNIFIEYIRAKKQKICPLIEYVD